MRSTGGGSIIEQHRKFEPILNNGQGCLQANIQGNNYLVRVHPWKLQGGARVGKREVGIYLSLRQLFGKHSGVKDWHGVLNIESILYVPTYR